LSRLYAGGLATASTRDRYRGLDVTAQTQQSNTTENWSFSNKTDTSGDNIDERFVRADDWSVDLSNIVFVHDDNVCIHSNCCNISASVTTISRQQPIITRKPSCR